MERLIILIVLMGLAVVLALVLQRRRPDPPSAPSYRAPRQLDRDDFTAPAAPTLVVVFASETCESCPGVWDLVAPLESESVAVQRVNVQADTDLHERYRIDGVPTTVVAAADGVVVKAFFGPLTTDELVDAVGRA